MQILRQFSLVAMAMLFVARAASADTLVICPTFLRDALAPWESFRSGQGHKIEIISPPRTSADLTEQIRLTAGSKQFKYVVLIGDVDVVPTCYVQAKVNVLWGSEPLIATDQPYADIDSDGLPDVAVGRIPADTPEELEATVEKALSYERYSGDEAWCRKIDVVAGVGGFGLIADSLIEASAHSAFKQVVPATYLVRRLEADPDATCRQIGAGSLAWIYLGHGLPTMLDIVATPRGPKPILATADIPHIACASGLPLAVLIACYTGAIDARQDCLGEELAIHRNGPIAAIAATRVTMPYGNSVLGCELLRATFRDSPGTLGDIWLQAQRQTLQPAAKDDTLRTSLDAIARGVSPPPVDLAAERCEHVQLYQLLGDPLLRIKFPAQATTSVTHTATAPTRTAPH